jgi:hypothetical protein
MVNTQRLKDFVPPSAQADPYSLEQNSNRILMQKMIKSGVMKISLYCPYKSITTKEGFLNKIGTASILVKRFF